MGLISLMKDMKRMCVGDGESEGRYPLWDVIVSLSKEI